MFSYVSLAHWVLKDITQYRFRLVKDLRRLNESVLSKALTFPTPAEVMTMVDPADTVFIVSDLVSGYHQL